MRHDCMEPMLVSNQPFIVCAVHLVCINACVLNYIDYYTIKFEFRRLACDDCRDWRLTTEYSNPWPIRRLISPGKTECAYVSRMCDIFLIFIRAPAAAGGKRTTTGRSGSYSISILPACTFRRHSEPHSTVCGVICIQFIRCQPKHFHRLIKEMKCNQMNICPWKFT